MNPEAIAETLDLLADPGAARRIGKHVRPLKGVRGVPMAEVARVATAAWRERRPRLPRDSPELDNLFSVAWEDGLVAIGLLAAVVVDAPDDALDLAHNWVHRIDDLHTADALGWLVLGPAARLTDQLEATWTELRHHAHPAARRAALATGLCLLPIALEGPSAAPLRARRNSPKLKLTEEVDPRLRTLFDLYLRDEAPSSPKMLRRLLKAWVREDPGAVVTWAEAVRGGIPKLLGDEVRRARKKAPE